MHKSGTYHTSASSFMYHQDLYNKPKCARFGQLGHVRETVEAPSFKDSLQSKTEHFLEVIEDLVGAYFQ